MSLSWLPIVRFFDFEVCRSPNVDVIELKTYSENVKIELTYVVMYLLFNLFFIRYVCFTAL